jgi:biopolymer transport protein ExbD
LNFKRKSEGEYAMRLPLVALIDVVLFLLLYFLIAGTLASPESQLSTAITADRKGGGSGSALTAQVLRVERGVGTEEAGARFVIGSRVTGDRNSLREVLKGLPKDAGIVIRVADDVTIGAAATALQVARDVGFSKVSYVAGK